MITFSLIGDCGIRCVFDKITISVFPPEGSKIAADITLLKNPEESPTNGVISWPGEYDMRGISFRGIGHKEGAQVSFCMEADGARCAFISSPLHDWSDYDLELLGNIDVLFLPSGEIKFAQKLIDEVDPRVLFPIANGDSGKLADLLKISGAQGKEAVSEYKLKGLPAEGREVVLLG